MATSPPTIRSRKITVNPKYGKSFESTIAVYLTKYPKAIVNGPMGVPQGKLAELVKDDTTAAQLEALPKGAKLEMSTHEPSKGEVKALGPAEPHTVIVGGRRKKTARRRRRQQKTRKHRK